jgi:hypothetical protein
MKTLAIIRPEKQLEDSKRVVESFGYGVLATAMVDIVPIRDLRWPTFLDELKTGPRRLRCDYERKRRAQLRGTQIERGKLSRLNSSGGDRSQDEKHIAQSTFPRRLDAVGV